MLTYRDWKALDPIRLSESFKKIDWNKILSLEKNDPDYSFCRFFDKLTILIDSHVPLKKMSKKQRNSLSKPWMTNEIRKSIRTRDSLIKKFKKEKRPNKKTELYNEYRFLRNRIVSQIRQSKLDHYRKFFNDNMKNSKRIWNGIREIISLKSKNKANRLSLDIDGHLISDQKEIAESLNNFFAQIADNIKSKLPPTNKLYIDFMGNPCRKSFFINPTSINEVMKIIGSIDHSKATGPYSIPKQVLSSIPLEISTILVEIFNLSFQTGKFISVLKQVKVVPVFKNKDSPYESGNYRPISLLSNVDKIM